MADPTTLPEFNPSGDRRVDEIKATTETLIQYILKELPNNRERAIALTNYEQACMWAVKSMFVK